MSINVTIEPNVANIILPRRNSLDLILDERKVFRLPFHNSNNTPFVTVCCAVE